FLDVRRQHAPQRSSRLHLLDALVKPRQREDGLDAVIAQRPFELVLGIGGIQRGDDGAYLPRAKLGDEELWTVGQHQRDAIAAFDAERLQRGRADVAQAIEL